MDDSIDLSIHLLRFDQIVSSPVVRVSIGLCLYKGLGPGQFWLPTRTNAGGPGLPSQLGLVAPGSFSRVRQGTPDFRLGHSSVRFCRFKVRDLFLWGGALG